MHILFLGPLWNGSTSLQRFSALVRLGHQLTPLDTSAPVETSLLQRWGARIGHRLRHPLDTMCANQKLLSLTRSHSFDVLWLEKALTVRARTLGEVKTRNPETIIVGYSPDDMANPLNTSRFLIDGLPLYDAYITTKSYNVSELKAMGVRQPLFLAKAFDPAVHYPRSVSLDERARLGGAVGFIGAFEEERALSMLAVARAGISVKWWCLNAKSSWSRKHSNLQVVPQPLWGDAYSRALSSFDINLCFLRKMNRDVQTARSIEIPACGGFMLAERTAEHLELFHEGREAEFFGDTAELIDKARFYLAHPDIRKRIAHAGWQRCQDSGYSNDQRLSSILSHLSESGSKCKRPAEVGPR